MRIAFTGASSFTGFWIIKELVEAGHEVIAFFQSDSALYQGERCQRVNYLKKICTCHFQAPFGSDHFLNILKTYSSLDILCHHAAEVSNYKSMEFDVHAAVMKNTYRLSQVLELLNAKNCPSIILTGSIFEQGEGISDDSKAFSPYGLSKGITYSTFEYYTSVHQINLKKFVITNPFGPYEEARFTRYLMVNWLSKNTCEIKTPYYFRDNIPVSLLAKAYNSFIQDNDDTIYPARFSPRGYIENVGDFTKRCANEVRTRLNLPCEYLLYPQSDFQEPKVRIGSHKLNFEKLQWNEEKTWDNYVEYYHKQQESLLCL